MRSAERTKVNVHELKCLRSLVLVSRMDRVRNEVVCMRAAVERGDMPKPSQYSLICSAVVRE